MTRRFPLLVLVSACCAFAAAMPARASAQILDRLGKAAGQAKQAHDDLTFTEAE